ncbi:MAG: putative protease SohB [Porticoccaceae bacterium UBA1117]|nr:protease SohB [Porticoccaceae bacterium]CAI8370798.1 MAG: putative protease SohB [Porticoccaceae bacterium UBA1117]
MEFLFEYGLFFAKVATLLVAFVVVVSIVVGASQKNKYGEGKGHLEITPLNQQFEDLKDTMLLATTDESQQKAEEKKLNKAKKKQLSDEKKATKKSVELDTPKRSKVYVLNFDGNISASAVGHLREEITAVLTQATPNDEVLLKLESSGGMVHSYGLASSQLDRLRKKNVPLTVCVDKVAASGGYMMACVADKILAAPFAIIGSIGVVAQMPNFNKVLKKHDVEFELLTAGEHKRTLTMFGENTDKGREKFIEELEETHQLFKEYVSTRRPQLDIDKIATGEIWYGSRAKDIALIDDIQTSDEYLVSRIENADVFEVAYVFKKKLHQRLGIAAEESADRLLLKWWARLTQSSNKHL